MYDLKNYGSVNSNLESISKDNQTHIASFLIHNTALDYVHEQRLIDLKRDHISLREINEINICKVLRHLNIYEEHYETIAKHINIYDQLVMKLGYRLNSFPKTMTDKKNTNTSFVSTLKESKSKKIKATHETSI